MNDDMKKSSASLQTRFIDLEQRLTALEEWTEREINHHTKEESALWKKQINTFINRSQRATEKRRHNLIQIDK
jgi:hypothetical protein